MNYSQGCHTPARLCELEENTPVAAQQHGGFMTISANALVLMTWVPRSASSASGHLCRPVGCDMHDVVCPLLPPT